MRKRVSARGSSATASAAAAIVEEALPIADLKSLANAYLYLHVVHALLGSPERLAFRGLALPLFEELGDLRGQATALNNLGIEAYYEGDWDKALDVYDRSRALFERIGDVISVAMANNNIGEIRSDQGALEEAQTLFEEVERACDAAGHRALSSVAHRTWGGVAARAGRVDEAEALLHEALAAFRGIHATSFVLETEARLAEVSALRGDRPQEALNRAESVLEHTEDAADMPSLHATALRLRAAARLQLGDRAGAEQDLEESLRAARAGDSLYELALALDLSAAASETTTRRARARRYSSSLPSRTWRDRRCLCPDELLRPAVGAGAVTSTQISSARRRTGLRERAGRRLRGGIPGIRLDAGRPLAGAAGRQDFKRDTVVALADVDVPSHAHVRQRDRVVRGGRWRVDEQDRPGGNRSSRCS